MKRNWRRSTGDRHGRTAAGVPVIVLGIDPGTLATGYGFIAVTPEGVKVLACGLIRNNSRHPMPLRLRHIYDELRVLIGRYRPSEFAIESAFYGKNAQSALKLGHARGVSILAAVQEGIPASEYSPREVKKAVVGNGNASKEQVQFMIRSLLRLPNNPMPADVSDALAVALCHLHRLTAPASRHRTWASYVAAHPERVRA